MRGAARPDWASFEFAERSSGVRAVEPIFCERNRCNLFAHRILLQFSRWLRSRWIRMDFARSRACSRGFSGAKRKPADHDDDGWVAGGFGRSLDLPETTGHPPRRRFEAR